MKHDSEGNPNDIGGPRETIGKIHNPSSSLITRMRTLSNSCLVTHRSTLWVVSSTLYRVCNVHLSPPFHIFIEGYITSRIWWLFLFLKIDNWFFRCFYDFMCFNDVVFEDFLLIFCWNDWKLWYSCVLIRPSFLVPGLALCISSYFAHPPFVTVTHWSLSYSFTV